jgi:hypothetical protein
LKKKIFAHLSACFLTFTSLCGSDPCEEFFTSAQEKFQNAEKINIIFNREGFKGTAETGLTWSRFNYPEFCPELVSEFQFKNTLFVVPMIEGREGSNTNQLHIFNIQGIWTYVLMMPQGQYCSEKKTENEIIDNALIQKLATLKQLRKQIKISFLSERDTSRALILRSFFNPENTDTQITAGMINFYRDNWHMHQQVKSADLEYFIVPDSISSPNPQDIIEFAQQDYRVQKCGIFAKPRFGMGALGGKRLNSIDEVNQYIEYIQTAGGVLDDYIFQEW